MNNFVCVKKLSTPLLPLHFTFAGEIILERDRCRRCSGHKIVEENSVLDVYIDAGMKKQKLKFAGRGDEGMGVDPGDLYIAFNVTPHDVFTRSGDDLIMNLNVSITESLCGIGKLI